MQRRGAQSGYKYLKVNIQWKLLTRHRRSKDQCRSLGLQTFLGSPELYCSYDRMLRPIKCSGSFSNLVFTHLIVEWDAWKIGSWCRHWCWPVAQKHKPLLRYRGLRSLIFLVRLLAMQQNLYVDEVATFDVGSRYDREQFHRCSK